LIHLHEDLVFFIGSGYDLIKLVISEHFLNSLCIFIFFNSESLTSAIHDQIFEFLLSVLVTGSIAKLSRLDYQLIQVFLFFGFAQDAFFYSRDSD